MKFLYKFIELLSLSIIKFFLDIYYITKLRIKYPTCRFEITSKIINCTFGSNVVIFGNNKLLNCKIDSYSYIQTNGRIYNCEIGKFCSIAANVSISPGNHELKYISTHPSFYQKNTPLPKVFSKSNTINENKIVMIGNDVWIGEKAIILDGLKIGNGAIIAAGSIVLKDVEPYAVVAGVPAKVVKYRFNDETIKILHESNWWNFPEDWFQENCYLLKNTEKFLQYIKNGRGNL